MPQRPANQYQTDGSAVADRCNLPISMPFRRIRVPLRSRQAVTRNGRIDADSHVLCIADSKPHVEEFKGASDGDADVSFRT